MEQDELRFVQTLAAFFITAATTHLVISFMQTVMRRMLGHHPAGGRFFRNHINFHHTYYSKDHLLSQRYLAEQGNNTPFFLIPVFLSEHVPTSYCPLTFLSSRLSPAQRRSMRMSFSTGNTTTSQDGALHGFRGSDANRNYTSFITGTRTAIMQSSISSGTGYLALIGYPIVTA